MSSKSCLLHHRSSLMLENQDNSLNYVSLPRDKNTDPLKVSLKRISQVFSKHYIAYIHSCLADLCLIHQ